MERQRAMGKSLNEYLDPYPYFGRLRESGRVVQIHTAFAGDGWLITRYEDAYRLANDPRLSVDTKYASPALRKRLDEFKFRFVDSFPDHMLIVDPPEHTRLRRLISKEFTPSRVAALEPYIRQTIEELIDAVPADRPIDLVATLAAPLPVRVIGRLLGIRQEDSDFLQPYVSALIELPTDSEVAARLERARAEIWEYLSGVIKEKRKSPDGGLLSALITAHDDDDLLSDSELTAMAAVLFAGGAETTAHTITSGLLLLLRYPEQWSRLIEEPELVPSAVEEMLRFESPVTLGLIRFAAEDITIGEVTIPRGDLVFVGLATSNHDGQRFEQPEQFDVTRRENPHLAFGRGVHFCLGAGLARLELKTVFSILVSRFPRVQLAVRPVDVPWQAAALRGPAELSVILEP
jgi:cytochrome P450